jgi:O-antigen/teichoic acid export membrane protein
LSEPEEFDGLADATAVPPVVMDEPDALISSALEGGGRLLGLRCLQFAFLFLLSLVAARALGPTGRGQYALALNLATMVWVISHISVEQSVARLMARKEASAFELARLGSLLALVLGLVGTALTLAIGLPGRDSLLGGADTATVVLAAATIPFTLIGQMATALLLRMGVLRVYGWIIAAGAAVQLALVVAFEAGLGLTPELAMLAALLTIAAVAVALAIALAAQLGLAALIPSTDRALLRKALAIGFRLQPTSIALWLNLKIDLFLVGLLTTTHAAGLYSLSANLADIVFTAISTIGLAALETQTRAEPGEAAAYTGDFISQNIGLALLLGLAASIVAYPFVVLVYGQEWQASVLPFVLLMPALVGLAVEGPARDLLIRIAPPVELSLASGAGLAVNIGLNFALIPWLGISGASIASVLSYWLAGLLMVYLVSRHGGIPMRRALRFPRRGDPLPRLLRRVVS